MNSLSLFAVAFVCPLIGAYIGMSMRRRLPQHHLSPDSVDVIKLTTGLMATLVVLILGLMLTSANTFRTGVRNDLKHALTDIVLLDGYLRAYGPETRDVRQLIHAAVRRGFRPHHAHSDFSPSEAASAANFKTMIEIQQRILALEPRDAAQVWFRSQAVQLNHELVRVIELLSSDQSWGGVPTAILIVVIFCSTMVFTIFSLFVQPNLTVVAASAASALTIAAGVFLIIEFNSPLSGLLEVSSSSAPGIFDRLHD